MNNLLFQGKTMETFFLVGKTGFVLKSEELMSPAYLPRSPYFATRDRRPNPFASGKVVLSPALTGLIPEAVASPPHIPDNPLPRVPSVPLAEESPSSSVVSEHLTLLDEDVDEPKKVESRPTTKLHARKASRATSEKISKERKRSLASPASSHGKRKQSSPTSSHKQPRQSSPESSQRQRRQSSIVSSQRQSISSQRQSITQGRQSLSNRHKVVQNPVGFTYTFMGKMSQDKDAKRKSSEK